MKLYVTPVAPNPGIAEHFRPILDEAPGVLEDAVADGREFVAGERCSVADCTLQAAGSVLSM